MKTYILAITIAFVSGSLFAQSLPNITTQPYLNGGFVCYGTDAEIKANVTNADTYQLQTKNTGSNTYSDFGGYSGDASGGAISINLVNVTQDLTLRVTFTNTNGTTNSDDFQVFAQRPTFTVQPQNQIQCFEEDVFYYVDDFGSGYSYQWQKSEDGASGSYSDLSANAKYKNVSTRALKLNDIKTSDDDFFRCVVADANGCENTSNGASLFVNNTSTIKPTTSTEFCEGGFANFFLEAGKVEGIIDSYEWTANDGTTNYTGSDFEEESALSFNLNKVPLGLDGVEVVLQFTNNFMQTDGSLVAGTCSYSRDRDGYIVNPKPASPTAVVADSVCGNGVMNLAVTDTREDWNWSSTPDGVALTTSKVFETPSLNESTFYYVSFTDANDCKSGPDSVLAKVNSLPTLTLGTVESVCPGTANFEIPYTNLSAGADKYSLSLASGSMADFVPISDAAITAAALTISLPANAANGNYTFNLVLENSTTECLSEVIPVNLYIQKPTDIITAPITEEICEEDSHTLTVLGDGEGTLSYQWFFNTNAISGAEGDSYQISNAVLSNNGSYYCRVTAICGFANSAAASLTVKPKTKISVQPVSKEVCDGSNADFSVTATGSGALTYQWKKDGSNIGTNASTLSLENVTSADNGAKITCLVRGDCGDSLSAEAVLTVLDLPLEPIVSDTGYCLNSSPAALMAMAADGSQINWYGMNATGGVASTSAPTPDVSKEGDFSYYVSQVDANSCESPRAEIKVKITDALTANLSTSTSKVCAHGELNRTILFTISGQNGDGNYTYQWGKDNVDIANETSDSYIGTGAGDYYVRIASGYCGITKTTTIGTVLASADQGPNVVATDLTLPYTICSGSNVTFNATTNTSGTDYKWYASPTGSLSINSTAILNVSNVPSNRTYYAAVQQTDGLTTCETPRTPVEIAVFDKPFVVETITPESCPGLSDGSVSLAPQTSNLPYQFKLESGGFQSNNTFSNLTAQAYQITLEDSEGCTATTSITMTSGLAPVFTTQPVNQINCDGNTVTFKSVTDAVYTMSWEKKLPEGAWEVLSDETDVDLKLTKVGNATNPHGTSYRVTATSASCSTVSDEVTLGVNDFTENLASQEVCAGDLVTWIPPATVGVIQNYEWQRKVSGGSFVEVQSGASPNYVINSVTGEEDADQYRVKVTFEKTGGTCLETSDGGTLNVTEVTGTTLAGTIEICEGESAPLMATGCNGTVTWSDNQEGETISVSPSETTVYTAVCALESCSVPASNSVTVSVKPGISAPTIIASKREVCFGDSSILSVLGCAGVILWSSGENTTDITAKSIGTVTYSASCSDLGCTSPVSNTIDVTAYPELKAGNISESTDVNCAGFNPSTISNETSPMGGNGTLTISWEESENCSASEPDWTTIPSASSETYNPTTLSKTTCYRRKVIDECGTEVHSNVSTIQIVDDPSVEVSSTETSICSNQSFTLTATVNGGTGVCNTIWQRNLKSSASGSSFWEDIPGTVLTNTISDLENTEATIISVYFRAIYDCDLTNCNKATSDAIEIKVAPKIEVVVNADKNDICEGESINVSAKACLGNLQWFDGSSDSLRVLNPIASGFLVATCSVDGCTSVAKDSVEITVRPGISAPIISATKTEICFGDSVILSVEGCSGDILWSNGETTDEIVVKPRVLTTYLAACLANSCISPVSNTIDVQGYPELFAGSIGTYDIVNCAGFNPATIISESDPEGGKGTLTISWEMAEDCVAVNPTWVEVLGETDLTYNPATIQKTTCYRRKVVDECGTEVYSNVSTIQIVDDPSVEVSSIETTICSNQSFTLKATVIGGTGLCHTIWQRNLKSSASGSSFWEDIPGTALTNTISDLENTEATTISVYFRAIYDCDLTNCNKATSDAIEIKVAPKIEVVVSADKNDICEGESINVSAKGCLGNLQWFDGNSGSLRVFSPIASGFLVATCSIDGCTTVAKDSVEITVRPGIPSPIISATKTEICFGDSVILSVEDCSGDILWSNGETTDEIVVKPMALTTYSATCSANFCISPVSNTIDVQGSPELSAGNIGTYDVVNCAGFNPATIISESDPEGGKGTLTISWEMAEDCDAVNPTWVEVLGETDLTYNPATIQKTTCYRRKVVDECGTEGYSNVSTIQVVDDPSVEVSSTETTICSNQSFTLKATVNGGTGMCNTIWQRNLKSSASGSTFWEEIPGTALTNTISDLENTEATTISVYFRAIYDCDLTNCNKATSDAFEIKVAPKIEVVVSADKNDICEGESINVSAKGCLGNLQWFDGSSDSLRVLSPTTSGYLVATCSIDGCTTVAKDSVEITVRPGIPSPMISATKIEVCFGDSVILSVEGCSGDILWSNGETTDEIVVKPRELTTYSATCSANSCISPVSNTIDVQGYSELFAGSIGTYDIVNCAGFNPATIISENDPEGGKGPLTISWEMAEDCDAVNPTWVEVLGETDLTYNPTTIQKTTCYRRKVIDECGTEVYSNISTIQIVDDPSVEVSSTETTICSNQSFTLTATVNGGTGLCRTIWQRNLKSSASGSSFWEDIPGTALTNTISDLENTEATTISVYFRAIYDCDLTNCNKATSDAIEIKVLPSSEVVLNITDSTVCIGNSVLLKASNCGGSLKWSDGVEGLTRTIDVVASSSYTATCTSDCGIYTATANINAIQGYEPPENTTPISAIQPDLLTFSAAGTNLKWYASATVDTSLYEAPTESEIGEYTYYVSQSNSTCESPRIEIRASVYSPLTIVNQPIDQYDCEGNSVYFSVEAIGAGTIFYQWQRKRPGESEFTDLKDGDEGIKFPLTANLRVSAVGDNDNPVLSQYRCKMSDSLSYIQSYERVLYANVIDGTIPNVKACVGNDFEFRLYDYVRTTGDIMSFQWQIRDDVIDKWVDISDDFRISGSNTPNMTIKNIQTYDNRKYRCSLVFNTGGFQCTENTDQTILKVGTYPNRPPDLSAEYCQGKRTKTLSFNGKPNDELWYTATNKEAIGFKKAPKPSSDVAGVYDWWFTEITKEGCESLKAKYTVTIHPKPELPASTTPQFVNEGDTLFFDAKGENLHWFTSRTGKKFQIEKPFYTEIDEYKHYVSLSSDFGCESDRTLIISFIQGTLGFKKELEDRADCNGNSVRFVANGKGLGDLEYAWERKLPGDTLFREIEGEIKSTLLVSKIGSDANPHMTQFRVKVSDTTGVKTSNAAYLLVNQVTGTLNAQYYCTGDNYRVNLDSLNIQGKVNEYQLQVQPERAWVTLDTVFRLDSTKILSFYDLKDSAFINSDYRIRMVFEAENGGTCARSTEEFNFKRKERPTKPEKLTEELCQYSKLELPAMDSLNFVWFEHEVDSSLLSNLPSDSAGVFTYYYAYQDTISLCLSEKDTFLLKVLPVDSVFLLSNEFVFCTEDTSSILKVEGISNYNWYRNDSLKTALGDTLNVYLREAQKESYFFETVYPNGCISPLKEIVVKIESCEAEVSLKRDVVYNLEVNRVVNEPICFTYPNPFKPNEAIDLYTENIVFETVEVVNTQGQLVQNTLYGEVGGFQKMTLNSDLRDGVYTLRILGEEGNRCEWKMVMAKR